jgi:hypothetical protein
MFKTIGIIHDYYSQKKSLLAKRDQDLSPLVEAENTLIQPKFAALMHVTPMPMTHAGESSDAYDSRLAA